MKASFTKMGEVPAIAEFHRLAEKAGITIRRFRLDRIGNSILITATDYSK